MLAALHRLGVRPVVLATAGMWRVPALGRALHREGHIPVHRGSQRAAEAPDGAVAALAERSIVLLYGEGRLPRRRNSGEAAPAPLPQRRLPAGARDGGTGEPARVGRRPPARLRFAVQAARGAGHRPVRRPRARPCGHRPPDVGRHGGGHGAQIWPR
ncbi:hypothetical protein LRS74_00495 [Streptomyces sp. LX-29]|uniref:hypothetical protein n=1 Tax=Streptomyces sp. LX-29 TaxID=2900152 RepID=UPI00240D74E8|nr:hypothetical protein [Streptomyces sp. LX-29]WFB05659.1 hypothetical protein LRS74_00495 [Streptomyces sp. LX-29]